LLAWADGNDAAFDRLVPIVHDELHRLARRYMSRERRGHSFTPTALVNEAYLRLVDMRRVGWQNRAHFLALAARAMRRVLIDCVRAKRFQKRGGGAVRVTLDDAVIPPAETAASILALDDALHALAAFDPRKAQVIELRFFGGLTVAETAAVLGVSPDTVMRDWRLAKAWLMRELRGDQS
jgi:RNA polymerase sigma factor (TIGR02999 family)